jgi:acyl carrier protein
MSPSPIEEARSSPSSNGASPTQPPALADVRSLILSIAGPALGADRAVIEEPADDFDLRAGGLIDSLGFIELIVAIEDEVGIELDFDDLDPEEITVLGPLARHVHAQALAAREGQR